ncbi:MAG TPA: hypothetical protein VIY73_11890, partial [Polyangiaceae bacterium]
KLVHYRTVRLPVRRGSSTEKIGRLQGYAAPRRGARIAQGLRNHGGRQEGPGRFKAIGRSARPRRLTPTTIKKLRVVLDDAVTKIEAILDPED